MSTPLISWKTATAQRVALRAQAAAVISSLLRVVYMHCVSASDHYHHATVLTYVAWPGDDSYTSVYTYIYSPKIEWNVRNGNDALPKYAAAAAAGRFSLGSY